MVSDTMRRVLSYKRGTAERKVNQQYQARSIRLLIQGTRKDKPSV